MSVEREPPGVGKAPPVVKGPKTGKPSRALWRMVKDDKEFVKGNHEPQFVKGSHEPQFVKGNHEPQFVKGNHHEPQFGFMWSSESTPPSQMHSHTIRSVGNGLSRGPYWPRRGHRHQT